MTIDSIYTQALGSLRRKKGVGSCSPPLASPVRDWQLLLFGGLVLIIVLFLFASITYKAAVEGPASMVGDMPLGVERPALDEGALTRALSLQATRAQLHAEYLR